MVYLLPHTTYRILTTHNMNSQLLEKIEKSQMKKVPDLRPGDTVRVHQRIKEGKKERVQVFEGVVLRVKGGGLRQSFLVRKISFGVGVEKNFLIHAPNIVKIEVKKRAQVRRAYLTYLRTLTGKRARLKDKQFDSLVVNVKESDDAEAMPDKEESKVDGKDVAVTELDAEEVADSNIEPFDDAQDVAEAPEVIPLSEVEKAENKEAAKDAGEEIAPDEGGQDAEIAEVAEGEAEAEEDSEHGKSKEGDKAEKVVEDKIE